MVDFQSPGVRVIERRTGAVAIPAVSPGVGALIGEAEKGPVNTPVRIKTPDEFVEVFGSFITGKYLFDEVNAFFNNGGEEVWVVRVAHYTNITDANTLTALKATTMLQSTAGAATAGSLTSDASTFPAYLPAGTVFDGEVDGGAVAGFTIQATVATITGSGASYAAGAGGDSITLNINGVNGDQVIDLSLTGGTQQDYIDDINAQLIGGYVVDDGGGELQIVTDRKGSGAGGNIVSFGGAAAAKTGFSAGAFTNAGPNNVANDREVTGAEFKALHDAGFPGSTITNNVTTVTWSSDTTGVASSVQYTSPANIATLIPGFDLALHSGTAVSGAANALLLSASSPGAWGNLTRVTSTKVDTVVAQVAATTAGSATSLVLSSVQRVLVGDIISVTKGADVQRARITNIDTSSKRVELTPSITVPAGGYAGTEDVVNETLTLTFIYADGTTLVYRNMRMSAEAGVNYVENRVNNTARSPLEVTDQGIALPTDPRPADVTSTLLGQTQAGTDGGTVVDADYAGSSLSKTGLYALTDNDEALMVAIADNTSATVQQATQDYLESRQDMFGILDVPAGLTPEQAVTHVQDTVNLGTSYAAIYYPWVRAVDPRNSAAASFPSCGYVMGVFARTFSNRNFGKAPAGIDDGRISNVVGVETEVKKTSYDILYPANINAIQSKTGRGVVVMGSRTLDPIGDFRQINVRMIFLVVKRVFQAGTEFALFENSNPELWARIRRFMVTYLRGLRQNGILEGTTDAESFFVICDETNNTASVRKSGKVKCRVGLYTPDTAEFLEITLEQDTRAIDAEVASGV